VAPCSLTAILSVFPAALFSRSAMRAFQCHFFFHYSLLPQFLQALFCFFTSVPVISQTNSKNCRTVSRRGGSSGLPTSTSAMEKSLVLIHSPADIQKPVSSRVVHPHRARATSTSGILRSGATQGTPPRGVLDVNEPPLAWYISHTMSMPTTTKTLFTLTAWLTVSAAIHYECFQRATRKRCIYHPTRNPTGPKASRKRMERPTYK